MKVKLSVFVGMLVLLAAGSVRGEKAIPLTSLERMPVREVTIFKDGHAFVLQSGKMPTTASGNVILDYLPQPIMGTFWPYSSDGKAELSAVTAARRKVLVDRTALNLRQLIEANIGARVIVTEKPVTLSKTSVSPPSYEAVILEILTRSGEELEAVSPPYSGEKLPVPGEIVLLRTADGTRAVKLDRILDIVFRDTPGKKVSEEEFRDRLTLKLDWGGDVPRSTADVGMVYLQKGIRWIPSYKISIDGKGIATVKLQATLINEMIDLDDVTAHLVIGVPSFAFQDTLDPMALQRTAAALGSHFQRDSRTAYAFSNAIMSQLQAGKGRAYSADSSGIPPEGRDLGPEVTGSAKNEDLFIFTVEHITLRKGERMVLPIAEFKLKYTDVYSLEIPFTPPPDVWRHFNSSRQEELAREFTEPRVIHKIRLVNDSEYPLTTAPALILSDGRILAQGLITYTAVGNESDLEVTTAVDISVRKTEKETKRTPNAVNWNHNSYSRIDLQGTITLTNFGTEPVEVKIIRHVLGNVDDTGKGGEIEMVNALEGWTFGSGYRPFWWNWYSWPYWWYHFNSVGRITWVETLEPDRAVDFNYKWHYYWR